MLGQELILNLWSTTHLCPSSTFLRMWFQERASVSLLRFSLTCFSLVVSYKQLQGFLFPSFSDRSCPPGVDQPHLSESNPTKLAELVLANAVKMKCRKFVRAKDIVKGNAKLNLAFVCNLAVQQLPCTRAGGTGHTKPRRDAGRVWKSLDEQHGCQAVCTKSVSRFGWRMRHSSAFWFGKVLIINQTLQFLIITLGTEPVTFGVNVKAPELVLSSLVGKESGIWVDTVRRPFPRLLIRKAYRVIAKISIVRNTDSEKLSL